MEPQISVIVPIYNVEEYLPECIESIINQTYKNLDIILIDDGSPDACGKICDSFAKKDSRIRVVHKENGGLSDARNCGITMATGEYINFVDSDDILPKESLEKLYELAQNHNAQMVIGGFERFYDKGDVFFSTDTEGEYVSVMNKKEAMKDFFRDGCQAWAVLYQRKVHENIFFPKGEINEDEAIVFQLLDRCSTVVVTNKVVYTYRCREESITTSSFSKKKLVWVKHCKDNLEWIKKNYPELEGLAIERYRESLLWSLTEMLLCHDIYETEIKNTVDELRKNKKIFWSYKFQSKKEKIKYWLACNMPLQIYEKVIRVNRRA